MRGIDRRSYGPGRRATDRKARDSRAWRRVLVLAVTLGASIYVLMAVRDASRPQREADGLRIEALSLDARRLAAGVDAAVAPLPGALSAANQALTVQPSRPLDAMERARALAPGVAFAVLAADGSITAAAGADAAAFAPGRTAPDGRLHVTTDALFLRQDIAGGRSLLARAPLPDIRPAVRGAALSLVSRSDGLIVASSRTETTGAAAASALGLDAGAPVPSSPVRLSGAEGRATVAAAPTGGEALIAAAILPEAAGRMTWLDDLWLLIAPLLLGVLVVVIVVFQGWRQARASRQWADTERRFRVAVEAARCGVWEWDLVAQEVTVSDYMASMLGLDAAGPVKAEALIDRVHPNYRDTLRHALDQASSFGTFALSLPVLQADAEVRWLDIRGESRGGRGSDGFTCILGVALDVTEARRVKARAEAAENRLRDGIESVSDAFVLFDRKGRLILWNMAFRDAFGFDESVLRKGALKADLNRIAALAIKSDRPSPDGRPGVREVELRDGRWLQLAERYTGDGGTVVIAADITVVKRQEQERRRAADALRLTVDQLEKSQEELSLLARKYEVAKTRAEAANQAKSEFLANMSHELRTPLNAINGFSEIMAAEMFGPLGDARYKGYAADIHKSGQHLLSLINDILDMAKIEAGKLTLHYEPVSMREICDDAIRLMRGKAEEAGLVLSLDAPDAMMIEADHRGLKQVMLNLISNAVKFTPEGGAVVIRLHQAHDDRLGVSVSDTGIGIAAEDLPRLAQPFEQVEGQHSKTTQGTGLGLALTKALIELHGGRLKIESEPGRGTTVSFDLPARAVAPGQTTVARAA